jgi:hypothetical protein
MEIMIAAGLSMGLVVLLIRDWAKAEAEESRRWKRLERHIERAKRYREN